jgi:hypothetical protein
MKGWIKLLLGLLLFGSLLPASAKQSKPPLRDTPEWIELSRLWRQLSEHWSSKVYSHQKFSALTEKLRDGVASLPSLEAKDYLDTKTRSALEEYFMRRALFIECQLYVPSTNLRLTNLDSYAYNAQTHIEDSLALLLWPPALSEGEVKKLQDKTRRDLAYEMEFLRRAGEMTQTIAARRQQAEKTAADGKAVNWEQFNLQALTSIRSLIDEYSAGRLKPSKETLKLRELIFSLTEEPLPPLPETIPPTLSPPAPLPTGK